MRPKSLSDITPLTSEQMRGARAMLGWEQKKLVEMSRVSLATVKRLESQIGVIDANRPTLLAVLAAFESAGIIVIDENGEGPGVRLRKRLPDPRGNIVEEAGEGPGVWLNAEPAISDEAAVPEMPEGVAKDYDGSAM